MPETMPQDTADSDIPPEGRPMQAEEIQALRNIRAAWRAAKRNPKRWMDKSQFAALGFDTFDRELRGAINEEYERSDREPHSISQHYCRLMLCKNAWILRHMLFRQIIWQMPLQASGIRRASAQELEEAAQAMQKTPLDWLQKTFPQWDLDSFQQAMDEIIDQEKDEGMAEFHANLKSCYCRLLCLDKSPEATALRDALFARLSRLYRRAAGAQYGSNGQRGNYHRGITS